MATSYLITDDGPLVIAIEESGSQALYVRVGSVWDDQPRREAGVWVEYQAEYLNSALYGPLLFSRQTWRALNREVARRFRQSRRARMTRWLQAGLR